MDAGVVELCLSPEVLTEIEEVLGRPELLKTFPLIRSEDSRALLRTLRSKSVLLTEVPKAFTLPRDPDDEAYTDLAIVAGASYLVTWNERHLSYLMRRDTPEGVAFCASFPSLKITDPPTFLREIRESRGHVSPP